MVPTLFYPPAATLLSVILYRLSTGLVPTNSKLKLMVFLVILSMLTTKTLLRVRQPIIVKKVSMVIAISKSISVPPTMKAALSKQNFIVLPTPPLPPTMIPQFTQLISVLLKKLTLIIVFLIVPKLIIMLSELLIMPAMVLTLLAILLLSKLFTIKPMLLVLQPRVLFLLLVVIFLVNPTMIKIFPETINQKPAIKTNPLDKFQVLK